MESAGSGYGIEANAIAGAVSVAVTDSVIANNGVWGVAADSNGPPVSLFLTNDQISGNGYGIGVISYSGTATVTVWLAQSTVAGNTSVFQFYGSGVINSYGNNYFADNGNNNSTTGLTTVGTQ